MKASRILSILLALGSGVALAGTAEVRFIAPEHFADIGTHKWEESANMDTLAHHLQKLAKGLPDGQVLHVDVLDVDLAGEPRDTRAGRLRVARDVDLPIIRLRYTLEAGGQVLRTGEERLTDLNYRRHYAQVHQATTPLYYEKRMLAEWFRGTFTPNQQAYAH